MDIEAGQSNVLSIHNRRHAKALFKVYKNVIVLFTIPLILLPIAVIGGNNTYVCFYVFLIMSAYWIFDIFHPAVTSLIPIALSTVSYYFGYEIMNFINIRNMMLDFFGILMFIVAIEDCNMHKRIAIKILLLLGCSHYRLCFFVYFSTMFLSMWISNTLACGLMMPLVKAIIKELEKLGIFEMYETVDKINENELDNKKVSVQRPTDFTVFYFLGIAYSSSIGGMATIVGSQTNQICISYSETMFPLGPKIEFPQFALLTLPGILVLETMVYLWMNFYFLGSFRIHNYSALQAGSTEEEALYVNTLLKLQYDLMGRINTKEIIVCLTVIMWTVIQIATSTYMSKYNSHNTVLAPTIICVLILFTFPNNLDIFMFCKKRSARNVEVAPRPSTPCLTWDSVKNEIHWSVLMVTGSSCAMFDALKESGMTNEFEKFLQIFGRWSVMTLVLVVVIFCKILTEFASNSCVAQCMLDHITRVSLSSRINPHILMLAGTLSSSLPFHTITGTPANAMVSSYFNISQRRMIYAGIGPSIFSITIVWFTVAVWSKAVWTDIAVFPGWATVYNITKD